jgi:nucleoside-diphosphate-sugar epimerase
MVYVGNLVRGVVAAELTDTSPGRAWWIADAEPYTLVDIVATVKRALADCGLQVSDRQLRIPAAMSRAAQLADRAVQRAGRYNTQLHVLGELSTTIACDISQARSDLGYEPVVSLAEGMRRSIRWCQDQGIEL